jgi:hypothetical protein|tara:strand:+ start:26 stop:1156 length:1131 start_codon:yes stop_codon:yes gene_type:complete
MAINLRSPHYTSTVVSNTAYTTLDVSIWSGSVTSPVTAQYNLRKSVVGTSVEVLFEISELIRDYLDITFDGNYSGQAVWVKTVRTAYDSSNTSLVSVPYTQIAFDGYWYFEEVQVVSPSLFITNRELFVLEDNVFRIPIYTSNNPTVVFYKDGEVIASEVFGSDTGSANQIKYVSIYGDSVNWDTYQERILNENGSYEDSSCLQSFFNSYSIGAVDKITISDSNGIETIKVNVIEECKYEPKKVTFINKFGALQDMYFFKKSKEDLTIKKESYKSNTISPYGLYSKTNHVNRDFNVVGKESISLSSGYLSEEYNEVFKQLLLSEKVWVTEINDLGEQVTPINVKTSSIAYKTSVNDRLVDYTIKFDKSFDTINNIR